MADQVFAEISLYQHIFKLTHIHFFKQWIAHSSPLVACIPSHVGEIFQKMEG
jgi:hypothetical protein